MRKLLLFLMATCPLLFAVTSFKQGAVPDPEDYSRSFLEVIRKKDKELYVNTFALTTADISWLLNKVNTCLYMSEENKQNWNARMGDSLLFVDRIKMDLEKNYSRIERWAAEDSVDLTQLEYMTSYFELEYDPKEPFYICEDLMICVKYKDRYFMFSVDEAVFVNGRWTYGEVDGVSERNQYWGYKETNVNVTADSTAVAPASYEGDVAVEMVLNKKQQKIQKKIDAENLKLEKLYQQMRESY